MDLIEIKEVLREVQNNYASMPNAQIFSELSKLKETAVEKQDQVQAKEIWILEQILIIQEAYVVAFNQMRSGKYYEGWCSLEKVELGILFLERHFKELTDEYFLTFIKKHLGQYQGLYPYKIFMSPEILEEEKVCSICKNPISIRDFCGHRVGEIYDGKICLREVTKMQFLGVALVESPVQKYSVPFISDPKTGKTVDHYNYGPVAYVVDKLESPFHNWDIQWTKRRQPHSKFKDVGRNDKCPCESGNKYKECCLKESGVIRPHCDIIFSVMPKIPMKDVYFK
jgi:hypothetical protein